LLVVIVIIAVLAAILFPVFAQARSKAKQTACLSNVRQLAFAALMYAQGADDVLPPVAYPLDEDDDDEEHDFAVLWPDLLGPYTKNEQIRRCPADPSLSENSFGLNELASPDFTDDESVQAVCLPLTAFTHPAETVMLGDLGTEDDLATPRPGRYKMTAPSFDLDDDDDARPSDRHFKLVNLALIDGHARSMPLSRFYAGQDPTDRWFLPQRE
jgi:type II secretory pathway pseudopilin PulG